MDYHKFASLCYFSCVLLLVVFVEEKSCATTYRRTSPAKRTCPPLKLTNGFARLRSKGRIGRYICNEGFKIVGEKTATCVRGQWEGSIPLCVKMGCLKVYAPKNGHVMEFYAGAVLGFFCDNGYSLNGSRSIYCDGISWNGTVPTCPVDNTEPETSCDFENEDLCGWTQDSQHNFDWRRHNFATPSGHVGTGPSNDHTKGRGLDGNYMYIESSSPRMVNDTARLFSPVYPPGHSDDACFVFWYHMFGATTGSLRVYQKAEDANMSSLTPIFSKSGDQGNQWFRGIARLNVTNKPFQIIVEGVRGTSYVSDSAIDDVMLTNGTDCLEQVIDTSVSTSTRIETGGGGEVFDDAQSCRSRCTSNPDFSSRPVNDSDTETPVMVTCECHVGCLDNGTCCPDYSSYCIMAKVTPSLPKAPKLEYRTIATVHYFPLSTPRPTLPPPPPLPPLPPKPTVITTQEPPSQTQTNNLYQTSDTFERVTNTDNTSFSDDHSVAPTTQQDSERQTTNLPTTFDEKDPITTDVTEEQFLSTSNLDVTDIDVTTEQQAQFSTSDDASSSSTVIVLDVNSRPVDTTLVPTVPSSTISTTKTVNLTTKPTDTTTMKSITLATQTDIIVSTTLQPVKQFTVRPRELTTTRNTIKDVTTTTPKKSTTPKQTIFYPAKNKKPYSPKKTTSTTTTTQSEAPKRTTKNKMMYYPNESGDKSNDAETNYLLKKELISQPKRSSGIPWPQTQQSTKESATSGSAMVIGIVGGIALLLVAFGVVAFAVVRRRRVAGGRTSMSDDSDVRFLTAEEVLDFNIGRPNEEDDRC